MIENRAVGTTGDIHRRKHASQGKKVKKNCATISYGTLFLWYYFFISDLRKQQSGAQCITFDEGYKVAKENNLHYVETGAMTKDGLKQLFEKAVSVLKLMVYTNDILLCEKNMWHDQEEWIGCNR